MENNNQIEELKEKYRVFYDEISSDPQKRISLKEAIGNFENETAPEEGIFPQNREYYIHKTAIVAIIGGVIQIILRKAIAKVQQRSGRAGAARLARKAQCGL